MSDDPNMTALIATQQPFSDGHGIMVNGGAGLDMRRPAMARWRVVHHAAVIIFIAHVSHFRLVKRPRLSRNGAG